MSNKIIILGSNGFIGCHLFKCFKANNFVTLGISRKKTDTTTHIIEDYFEEINTILSLVSTKDIIINCLNDFQCQKKKIPFILFFISKLQTSIKLVQISSLSVYDSKNNLILSDEFTTLSPKTRYGKLKLIIEEEIQKNAKIRKYLILRVGGVFSKERLPKLIKFKNNKITSFFINLVFFETNLYLINIKNLEKKILYLVKNNFFEEKIINIFYKHNFIKSKKNSLKIILKYLFFSKYYLNVSNDKMMKIFF